MLVNLNNHNSYLSCLWINVIRIFWDITIDEVVIQQDKTDVSRHFRRFKVIETVGARYRSLCESMGTLTYSREHVLELLIYVDVSGKLLNVI